MSDTSYNLDLKDLNLPSTPEVQQVRVSEMIDSIGEPALRVWVIFKEPISDEARSWRRVRPIEEEIRQVVRRRHGVERFPYFSFVTPTELAKERIG